MDLSSYISLFAAISASALGPFSRFDLEDFMPEPLSPVREVGLDLGEEAASNWLWESLALLPRSHRVDVHSQESRQHRLAGPDELPDPLDVSRPVGTRGRRFLVGSDRQLFAFKSFGPQNLGCLLNGRQGLRPG